MCFGASASLVSGVVVGSIGVATLPLVRDRRELTFAALPLAFGAHQLVEGVIWLQVDEAGSVATTSPAVVAWLLFAWLLLPVWVPLSVRQFEPDPARRRWMVAMAVVGLVIGSYLFLSGMTSSTVVVVDHHRLEYGLPLHPGWLLALPYLVATCLPLLVSSRRFANWFGVAMVLGMGLTTTMATKELTSVWCFFATVLSAGLLVHYALERHGRRVVHLAP